VSLWVANGRWMWQLGRWHVIRQIVPPPCTDNCNSTAWGNQTGDRQTFKCNHISILRSRQSFVAHLGRHGNTDSQTAQQKPNTLAASILQQSTTTYAGALSGGNTDPSPQHSHSTTK